MTGKQCAIDAAIAEALAEGRIKVVGKTPSGSLIYEGVPLPEVEEEAS